jgi:hypothetical protein
MGKPRAGIGYCMGLFNGYPMTLITIDIRVDGIFKELSDKCSTPFEGNGLFICLFCGLFRSRHYERVVVVV